MKMTLPSHINVPSPLAAAVSLTLALMAAAPCAAQDAKAPDADQSKSAPAAPSASASQPAPDTRAASNSAQVQTVVVTAQKRSEREQDVPISMTALDTSNMSAQGQVKLADFFADIPGVSFVQSSMSSSITMRGIGTQAGIGVRPTSGTTIDDVPYGSSTNTGVIPDLDPSDLERIEVLRGPQGTLYGVSSMGGLLKYVTLDPDPCCKTAHVEMNGSDVAHGGMGYGFRASGNLPVSSTFALRGSIFKREDAGYVKNVEDGQTNKDFVQGGRVAALWKLTNKVTVRASAMVQDTSLDGSSTVDTTRQLQPIEGQYLHDRVAGSDTYKGVTRFYTTKVTADLDWATLESITGFSESRMFAVQDVGYTSIGVLAPTFAHIFGFASAKPSAVIDNGYNTNKFSQEFRLSSSGDTRLRWQLGAFYTREGVSSTQNFYIADKPSGQVFTSTPLLINLGSNTYKEGALFADSSYSFTDRFDVQVGGRYAENRLADNSYAAGALSAVSASTDSSKDHDFTYLFTPRYKLSENAMTYLRVASGYRAGGANGISDTAVPASYKSDQLVSYELGLKGQFLDRKLGLDAAVFRINWSDIQIGQVDLTKGSSYTTNAGNAISQGLELSATYKPTADWKLTANYAFTDAKLTQDIPGYVQGSTAYGKSGDRLPYSARNGASASVTRYVGLDNGLQAYFGGDGTYAGSRYMEFTQSATLPRIFVPSYTTFGLNAGVQGRQWSLTFYVRNLTDEKGYTNVNRRASSTTTDNSATTFGATLIQPRTVGVTTSWDY
jgi:iron complex outermembrane receptor protein